MQTLSLGSTGADVQLLQTALARVGFDVGEPDGFFGLNTHRGVIAFQAASGLVADGIVGSATWRALMPYITGFENRRIVSGDTFWRLANTYNTTVEAIQTANPTVNPSALQIGQQITIPLGFSVTPTNIQYTAHLTDAIIDGLAARYPFLRVRIIGRSVMGKLLRAVIIGNGPTPVCYNATHHANEWITTPILLKYLEEYAQAYATGGSISNESAAGLYSQTTLHIIPLVNPDGLDLVAGTLNSGLFYDNAQVYAANYPGLNFPSGWKANIRGVDLNLQYPAGWELAREIKFAQGYTLPGPRDYVGPASLSEPESSAMFIYTVENNFALTLSYHTQGEVIYWRYLDYMPPRAYEIGRRLSEASGYVLEETPYASGHAGYKDWFIQRFNRPGYTIEAGSGINPLPIAQFDRIYRDNIGLLTMALREA